MGNPWMPDEDAALRAHYPRHGAVWEGWALLLPHRSECKVRNRARRLGLRYDGPSKAHGEGLAMTDERAVAAVAALSEWQATRLALLVAVAGKEVDW